MKIIFLLLSYVFAFNASSQTIFQKISFNEALAQSQKTGKLILLQLETLDCEMCNYVATKAFENEVLSKKIKETFIAIKVDSKHSDRKKSDTATNPSVCRRNLCSKYICRPAH